MNTKNKMFTQNEWRWSNFLKYIISKSRENKCLDINLPTEFNFKESTYGSKKDRKKVYLSTWAFSSERINFARSISINSPNYSVLNFLIVPNTIYNMPFFGVDFVSLDNFHLLVLDFQPSITLNKQFNLDLLDKLLKLKNDCHKILPLAEPMSSKNANFFSPGLIWSKLPKNFISEDLISTKLYYSFKDYLDLYIATLKECNKVDQIYQQDLKKGQKYYLEYRRQNDPARPMLNLLFGKHFTESLINNVLFRAN